MGLPMREVGTLEKSQSADSGIGTCVGSPRRAAPGPVNSTDPPVKKKPGTPGGRNTLPVAIVQLERSKLACMAFTGLLVK